MYAITLSFFFQVIIILLVYKMPFAKELITNQMISNAIIALFPSANEDLFSLLERPLFNSDSVWFSICRAIFPDFNEKRLRGYIPSCYQKYMYYKESITNEIIEALKPPLREADAATVEDDSGDTFFFNEHCRQVSSTIPNQGSFCRIDMDEFYEQPQCPSPREETGCQSDTTDLDPGAGNFNEASNKSAGSPTKGFSTDSVNSEFVHQPSHSSFREGSKNYADCRKEVILQVPASFWAEFWNYGMSLKANWTDELEIIFANEFPYCVLSFKWHECSKTGGKKKIYFQAAARCLAECCNCVFKFKVHSPIADPFCVRAKYVTPNKIIVHDGSESQRRRVKGRRRIRLKQQLENCWPIKIKYQLLDQAGEEKMKMGNLNEALSSTILRKIKSEGKCESDLSKDQIEFMQKLIKGYQEKWKGREFKGFIQDFALYPYRVIFFTEDQLKVVLAMKTGEVFWYLDATGSLVKRPDPQQKQVYYYSIVLSGDTYEERPPFPVAEFISTAHSVPYIEAFLSLVIYRFQLLTTRSPLVDKIETDFSMALLQAVSSGVNKISLIDYINCIYRHESRTRLTTIHICSSHMIKTFLRKLQSIGLKRKSNVYAVAAKGASNLIHCDTVEKARDNFMCLVKIFCQKADDDEREIQEQWLKDFKIDDDKELPGKEEQEEKSTAPSDDLDSRVHNDFDGNQRCDSLYYQDFSCLYEDLMMNKSVPRDYSHEWYRPEIVEYLLKVWLPYLPLWCAIEIKKFNLVCASNATIENWHKILKYYFYDTQNNIPITRFIQKPEMKLPARLKERTFSLKTERQKKRPKARDRFDETAEEFWSRGKKNKRRENSHFPPKKQPPTKSSNQKKKSDDEKLRSSTDSDSLIIKDSVTSNLRKIIGEIPSSELSKFEEDVSDLKSGSSSPEPRIPDKNITSDKHAPFRNSNSEARSPGLDAEKNYCASQLQMSVEDAREQLFSRTLDYPDKFPQLEKNLFGYYLNAIHFKCLRRTAPEDPVRGLWIDDNIINAFGALEINVAQSRGNEIIAIDAGLIMRLNERKVTLGMRRWLVKMQLSRFKYWLYPILFQQHWTLLVVDFTRKYMVYLDSQHCAPPGHIIDAIAKLVELYGGSSIEKDWRLYAPRDIPRQCDSTSCGVFVCIWMYIICNSVQLLFDSSDIVHARRGISRLLMDGNQSPEIEKLKINRTEITARLLAEDEEMAKKEKKRRCFIKSLNTTPENFATTLQYCAHLCDE